MAQNVNDDEQDTKSEVGYVYAMSTQTLSIAGVFKIGVTNDLHRRKKDLSASTSAPEEFHVAYFVRCKSMQDAKRLESSVKRTLDEEGCTYRPNREFYRLGTVVPLWGCFREGAEALGITIVENIRADPCEIIDETYNEVVISKVHFDAIDTAYRKFYLRGAQDLSGLIMLSELSAEQSELAASIYGRLSDTVIPNPDPLSRHSPMSCL